MFRPDVLPITDDALEEFSAFLQQTFGGTFTRKDWRAGFEQKWCEGKPNNGFMLRDDSRIVGAIGTIYADRKIRGNTERFCNITSWSVLPEYRMHSMRLATAVTSQNGLHFTDLTPTNTVAKSLQFLKFKAIDARQILLPNTPSVSRGRGSAFPVLDDPQRMRAVLPEDLVQVMDDHLHFPWLRQVVIVLPNAIVHVVYKPIVFKRVPCAFILAVSDHEGFSSAFAAFRHYLLFRRKILCTRLERRFLTKKPSLAYSLKRAPRKLFYSPTLTESDIDNLYSELVSFDMPAHLL